MRVIILSLMLCGCSMQLGMPQSKEEYLTKQEFAQFQQSLAQTVNAQGQAIAKLLEPKEQAKK